MRRRTIAATAVALACTAAPASATQIVTQRPARGAAVPEHGGPTRRITSPPRCHGRQFLNGFARREPGGRSLVFARGFGSSAGDVTHGSELFTVSRRGGHERRLTRTHYRWWIEDLAVSPQGRLAVSRSEVFPPDPTEGDQFIDNAYMWVAERDGSRLRRIPRIPEAGTPSWAPSGRRFVFSADNGIFVAGRRGRYVVRISPTAFAYDSVWSPRGVRVAYTRDSP